MGAFDDVDVALSEQVQHAWAEFARTGIPRSVDGAAWPACLPGEPVGTVIGDTIQFRPLEISAVTTLISSQRRDGTVTQASRRPGPFQTKTIRCAMHSGLRIA
jgi:hypothetical protein